MAAAKTGDRVAVHYVGKLDDGTVFDTSRNKEPLQFKIGKGGMIPAFETAFIGMEAGQSKSFTIEAKNAYGPYHNQLVLNVPRVDMPAKVEPEIGQRYEVKNEDGQKMELAVTAVTDKAVTLDANHPLAGKDLSFEVELVEVC